ncbi:MAG: hypothetical protein IT432_08195, partial [Phycisphaerales bacterium]|nr:hypothetical protein [Phycisphaerales bacterium]
PLFEVGGDGTVGISDAGTIGGWIGLNQYDVRADADMDSDLDSTDNSAIAAATLGRGVLSGLGNRIGYAGYRLRTEVAGTKQYARARILDSETGRWLSRDSVRTADLCAYAYGLSGPIGHIDPMGLRAACASASDSCGPSSIPGQPQPLPPPSLTPTRHCFFPDVSLIPPGGNIAAPCEGWAKCYADINFSSGNAYCKQVAEQDLFWCCMNSRSEQTCKDRAHQVYRDCLVPPPPPYTFSDCFIDCVTGTSGTIWGACGRCLRGCEIGAAACMTGCAWFGIGTPAFWNCEAACAGGAAICATGCGVACAGAFVLDPFACAVQCLWLASE